MRKLKLCLIATIALFAIGMQTTRAAAIDYLTGWTEVTSLPTSNDDLDDYYYVFVSTDADLMVAQEKNVEQESEFTVVYRYPMNPYTWKQVVWTLEYNATYQYGIRNLANSTDLLQTRENNPWRIQARWEATQSQWTQWLFAYSDGKWTIQNGKYPTYSEKVCYWGAWHEKQWINGEVLAANKSDDNIGHFKIYKILRSDYATNAKQYPTDVTSLITNPSFDDGDAFARKKANAVSTAITGWTISEGGNYQYYTVGKSRSNTPDNDSGYGKEITAANGTQYVHIRHGWRNSTTSITQTLSSMPEGEYVLTLDHKGATPQDKSPKLTVKATPATGSVGGVKYSTYPTSKTRDNSTYTFESNYGDWSTIRYEFFVTATGNVELYIGCQDGDKTNTSNDEVIFDNLRLTYKNYTATLQSALDRANLLYTRTSDSDLKDAIDHAQDVLDAADNTTSYQSTINSEVTTLRSAISTAYDAVEFASGENISFLLENASFESSDALPANVTTSFNNINTTDVYVKMQPVEGWTIGSTEDNILAGAYEYGADYGITGYTANGISTPVVGHSKAIVMLAGWGAKTQYKQNVTLPAGRYSITVPVYNKGGATAITKNLIGFIEDGGTEHLATTKSYTVGSWTTTTIEFDLNSETSGYMSVGYTSKSGEGSGNMPRLYIDGFTITYTDAENAYTATKTAAQAIYDASEYANVKGTSSSTERSTLKALLDADASSYTVDQYFEAIDNINEAVAAFIAAKDSYDEYAEAAAIASTISATSVTAPTTAEEAVTRAQELNVNIDTKVNDTYTFDITTAFVGSWTGSIGTTTEQHWSGNGSTSYFDNNGSSTVSNTQTISFPAGNYILKLAGRGSANATAVTMTANGQTVHFKLKGDTGVGIDKTGAANFASTADTYCNSNNGRGWEWRFIPLSLDEATDITVTMTIERSTSTWASFSDFTILQSGDVAAAADYEALSSAIESAEARVIGFETGEYAPYNNLLILTKLATAKAIDSEETNSKIAVNSLTEALNNDENWNANDGEVNAFNNNGNFVKGKLNDTGWQNSAWVGEESNYIGVPNGTSITYGSVAGFEMPLKSNTVYELKFRHSGWDGSNTDGGGSVSVLNASNEGLSSTSYTGNSSHDKGDDSKYKDESFLFTTGTAGNYVFTLTGAGGRTTVKGFSIKKVPAASVTVTAAGFATFCHTYPLDFSKTAIKAYKVKVNEKGVATLTKVNEVPANTPVLLYMKGGATEDIPVIASADAVSDNDLVAGTGDAVATTDGEYTNMILNNIDSKIGFYFAAGQTVATNRAYLHIATTLAPDAAASRMVMVFADETTGVNDVRSKMSEVRGTYYNLNGQRVEKPAKGLYIVNGKKVIIK